MVVVCAGEFFNGSSDPAELTVREGMQNADRNAELFEKCPVPFPKKPLWNKYDNATECSHSQCKGHQGMIETEGDISHELACKLFRFQCH